MPSSTARLTTGHSVWSSTSGQTDSAIKNIQSTTPASSSVSCTIKNQLTIVETTTCSDILKLFEETLEPAQSCSVNSYMFMVMNK